MFNLHNTSSKPLNMEISNDKEILIVQLEDNILLYNFKKKSNGFKRISYTTIECPSNAISKRLISVSISPSNGMMYIYDLKNELTAAFYDALRAPWYTEIDFRVSTIVYLTVTFNKVPLLALITNEKEKNPWFGPRQRAKHGLLCLYTISYGKILIENFGEKFTRCIFSPDNHWLLACSEEAPYLSLWNLKSTSKPYLKRDVIYLTDLTIHKIDRRPPITCIAFSADGTWIASACTDNKIRLWYDKKVLLTLTGHTDTIINIIYSNDGYYLASISYDMTIRLWNAKSGVEVSRQICTSTPTSCVFTPDNKALIVSLANNTIQLWAFANSDIAHEIMKSS